MTSLPPHPSRGFLLVLSGPSGAGKGTVVRRVAHEHEEVELSISATTRQPRPGEVNGRDYFFMDDAQFADYRARGGFLEWAEVYGHLYGTPRAYVEERLNAGHVVILEIDNQGAKTIMDLKLRDLVTVFLTPSSGEKLKERLLARGTEAPMDMTQRLRRAPVELLDLPRFDYLILNDDLERAVAALSGIILAEQHRVSRWRGEIELGSDFPGRGASDGGSHSVTP